MRKYALPAARSATEKFHLSKNRFPASEPNSQGPVASAVACIQRPPGNGTRPMIMYLLMGLIAGIRQPKLAGEPDPAAEPDVASVYARATR